MTYVSFLCPFGSNVQGMRRSWSRSGCAFRRGRTRVRWCMYGLSAGGSCGCYLGVVTRLYDAFVHMHARTRQEVRALRFFPASSLTVVFGGQRHAAVSSRRVIRPMEVCRVFVVRSHPRLLAIFLARFDLRLVCCLGACKFAPITSV